MTRPHLVIDCDDLEHLPEALMRIQRFWETRGELRRRRGVVLAAPWMDVLKQQLAPDVNLRKLLGPTLLAERADTWRDAQACASAFFSEEQVIVLDRAERLQRQAIGGCAGSGKTLLAMAIAHETTYHVPAPSWQERAMARYMLE